MATISRADTIVVAPSSADNHVIRSAKPSLLLLLLLLLIRMLFAACCDAEFVRMYSTYYTDVSSGVF